MAQFKRAAFLGAAAGFVAAPSLVHAQSSTPMHIAASSDTDAVSVLYGAQSGIFSKLGLDVDVQRLNSGSAVAAAVAGGSIDIGKASVFTLINAHAKGIPFVIVAPSTLYLASASDFGMLVAQASPFKTASDLNGKIIGVPALGDYSTITASTWIDKNGGDSKTVKFIEIPPPSMANAIATNRIDACVCAEPLLSNFVHDGKCRVFARVIDALSKRLLVTAFFSTADYAAKNADALTRFRKGLNDSITYALAHRQQMIPIIAKYTGLDPATVASMQPPNLAVSSTISDPLLIQPTIDAAATYKAIAKGFAAKEIIDPNLLAAK